MDYLKFFKCFLTDSVSDKVIGYHVTSMKNLMRINEDGLIPNIPGDFNDVKGVYLFKTRDDMHNALMGWFGERIEEWEEEFGESYNEVCLVVDITGLKVLDSTGYEFTCLDRISPDRIIDVEYPIK